MHKKNISRKKTITYFVFNTKKNGGNKLIFEHVSLLSTKGYTVRVITLFGQQPTWYKLPVSVISFFSVSAHTFSDILVATYWPTVWVAYVLPAKKKFYFVQGWEEDIHRYKILRKIARLTHFIPFNKIANSLYVKRKILQNFPRNHIKVIPPFIDSQIYKPVKKVKKKHIEIISVVSWYKWAKGIDLLTNAVEQIKKNHPEYVFTLISLEKNPYSSIFDRFISNPTEKNLVSLYQNSTILLSTSRSEGFFIPGLEAIACGCIFLTTNSGGIAEYAKHNYNAVILDRIEKLWEHDYIERLLSEKKLLKQMRKNSKKSADHFTKERTAKLLEEIYQ